MCSSRWNGPRPWSMDRLPVREQSRMAAGPQVSRTRRSWRVTSSSASSQPIRSKRPLPLGPTRRRGWRSRSGWLTRSAWPKPRTQACSGGISGVHFRGSVLIFTMRPSRTWALTTQRPPQLWPQVLVTIRSPWAGVARGVS